jgi:ribulose-5-phosphate 4-epimerase/fuculose-1-phosphate aldolase
VPVFEMTSEGGTSLSIRTQFAGQALAETMGTRPALLIRGHGAVAVATSLHAAAFRAYHMNLNARLQAQAILLGGQVSYMETSESRAAQAPEETEHSWDLWKQKLFSRQSTSRSDDAETRQPERFSVRASGTI